jgi:hypothetical protein
MAGVRPTTIVAAQVSLVMLDNTWMKTRTAVEVLILVLRHYAARPTMHAALLRFLAVLDSTSLTARIAEEVQKLVLQHSAVRPTPALVDSVRQLKVQHVPRTKEQFVRPAM